MKIISQITGIASLLTVFVLLVVLLTVFDIRTTGNVIQENFNLEIELPQSYRHLPPGEEIWFTIKLLSLANVERVDVTLEYEMLNPQGQAIASKSETVAVETQASFVGSLKIPQDAAEGKYVLRTILHSEAEGIESAQTDISFTVSKSNRIGTELYYYAFASLLFVGLLVYIGMKGKTILRRVRIRMQVHRIVKSRFKRKA